jgi:outer membrane protein assembly factor BamB
VAFHTNATHTGAQTGTVAPPLRELWAKGFVGRVSYPIVAGGRIFVTVDNLPESDSSTGRPSTLYAFDERTGLLAWPPIKVGKYSPLAWLAYEGGRLFVAPQEGPLRALEASTGRELWSTELPYQDFFFSPPTPFGGVVYITTSNLVYAVRASDGSVLWSTRVSGGTSSPAVTSDSVFVSFQCARNYGLDRAAGSVRWNTDSGCSGGGGTAPTYYQGRVYMRDYNTQPSNSYPTGDLVYDANTGTRLGRFVGRAAPAFDGQSGYFLDGGTLRARPVGSDVDRWSFTGDGALNSAPAVMNGYIYVASSAGNLFAVRSTNGGNVWSAPLGAGFRTPDESASVATADIGVGDNLVVVPAYDRLVVFGT